MANYLFGLSRGKFLLGTLTWAGNIKVILFDTAAHTPAQNTDEFYTDLSTSFSADIVATSPNLTGLTTTLGAAGAATTSFTAVSGDTCEALIAFKDTGTPSTSSLIFKIDSATGLPIIPNGANINVTWPSPIFTL